MKENLLKGKTVYGLRFIAKNLGMVNVDKMTSEELKPVLLNYSYTQLVNAVSVTNSK